MRWATRSGVHMDRTACAWLIQHFIDAAAEFMFVSDPDDVPADATPLDMRGVELSHRGGACTFETLLERYRLEEPALHDIARIVHEADLEDERYDAPEARGLDAWCAGCRSWPSRTRTCSPHRPALRRPLRVPAAGDDARARARMSGAARRDLCHRCLCGS